MADLSIAEQSARAVALGQYARFLLKRYQRLELIEIGEADPVSLRQIFVPMQVGEEDLRDEEVGEGAEKVADETLPGKAAWDVLIEKPFVLLSGRPGSGKTTLVQAIVSELCNNDLPSRLRRETRAVPVPFVLRNITGLETVRSLEDLFSFWLPLQAEQAEHDRLPLDVPRLQAELLGDGYPAATDLSILLLFDGIDEVGGPELRQRLLNLAFASALRGFRVLVTGRPTGFADLKSPGPEPLQLHYLLPFAWEQIVAFVDRWYRLRDEWARKRKEGVDRFLGHLADRGRSYLLSLARRPIFLTLMALVHVTRTRCRRGGLSSTSGSWIFTWIARSNTGSGSGPRPAAPCRTGRSRRSASPWRISPGRASRSGAMSRKPIKKKNGASSGHETRWRRSSPDRS